MQEGTIASINCQPMIEHLFDASIVESSENFKRGKMKPLFLRLNAENN